MPGRQADRQAEGRADTQAGKVRMCVGPVWSGPGLVFLFWKVDTAVKSEMMIR